MHIRSFPGRFCAVLLAFAGGAAVTAQTVTTVQLSLVGHFLQSGNNAPALQGATLEATVFGSNLSGIAAPTFTVGGGNKASEVDALQNETASRWNFNTGSYGTLGALLGDYGAGTYSFTANGTTYSTLGFPSTTTAPNVPQATVSAGIWNGSVLSVDPTQSLTITSNTFGTGASGHYVSGQALITIGVFDAVTGVTIQEMDTSATFSGQTLSLTLPANALTAGQSYDVALEFDVLVDAAGQAGPDTTTLAGVNAFSSFERNTGFTIEAVPEPATYALLGGLAALGVVCSRRRRGHQEAGA